MTTCPPPHTHTAGTKPSPKSTAYMERYIALVTAAAAAYGNTARFFLACGPMADDYCDEVGAPPS